ncbi:hypothetical protein, partial [Pseudanabaena sp. 'Roaring Creek']|uniref:hypothetical protein n=1 Tax=Pseudanabaena sp. 'Roaring Creek' TaxID=1681830 RepID=UPI000A873D3A
PKIVLSRGARQHDLGFYVLIQLAVAISSMARDSAQIDEGGAKRHLRLFDDSDTATIAIVLLVMSD